MDLLQLLEDLERCSTLATVHFEDGEVLELRIISTLHAEEGGDFAAELIRCISTTRPLQVRDSSFLNCYLAEIMQIWVGDVRAFERKPPGG